MERSGQPNTSKTTFFANLTRRKITCRVFIPISMDSLSYVLLAQITRSSTFWVCPVCPSAYPYLKYAIAAGAKPDFPMLQRFAGFDTDYCSLHFIYGDSDWIAQVDQTRAAPLGLKVSTQNVPQAGHLLYVDNPEGFDGAVRDALRR